MKAVFADSFYFFALLNSHDPAHEAAQKFAADYHGQMFLTGWVLTEVGDGLARYESRSLFAALYDELRSRSNVTVAPCSDTLLDEGKKLYATRGDKRWSLTDCISFVVMQKEGIREALTRDHHFEQAGFVTLLK